MGVTMVAMSSLSSAYALFTTNTGVLFMAVRHCSPLPDLNSSAMLRTGVLPSAMAGLVPGMAKRPITGVRPGRKTCAREMSEALPLLSK